MTTLILFTIIYAIQAVSSSETPIKIYNKNDKNWLCYDRGIYNIFCDSLNHPKTVTCKFHECTPTENKYWEIHHIHTCYGETCVLHTVAIPKNEFHPVSMLMCIFVFYMLMKFW